MMNFTPSTKEGTTPNYNLRSIAIRKDMKKVIIERPRVGGGFFRKPPKPNSLKLVDDDCSPTRESMRKGIGYDGKEQTDVLGPLKRFLTKNVGRRWDDVWSEVCEHTQDFMGDHLRRHVSLYVEVNVHEEDGKLVNDRGIPVGIWRDEFYVDLDGILRKVNEYRRYRHKKPEQNVFHMDGKDFYKHEGIWYRVKFGTPLVRWFNYKKIGFFPTEDVFGKSAYFNEDGAILDQNRKAKVCIFKEQACKKECKRLNKIVEDHSTKVAADLTRRRAG